MREIIFKTFVAEDGRLENEIQDWLKSNHLKEIDRSAPALTISTMHKIIVAVTVTAEKYN